MPVAFCHRTGLHKVTWSTPKEPFLTPCVGTWVWGLAAGEPRGLRHSPGFWEAGRRTAPWRCRDRLEEPLGHWMLVPRPAPPRPREEPLCAHPPAAAHLGAGLRAVGRHGPGVFMSSAGGVWECDRPGLTQGHCVKGAFRTLSPASRFDCGSESPFRRDFPPRLTHAASCV